MDATVPAPRSKALVVLGSTGSIGLSTLDVVAHLPDRFHVHGLCAHTAGPKLLEQAVRFRPRYVALTDPNAAAAFDRSALPVGTELLVGCESAERMATDAETDIVVSAIVGVAGLRGTWAAVQAGKTVALANKETLVVAGELVTRAAREQGATLLPVDSEHSAVFQAIVGNRLSAVERIVLTGSGGPFRGKTAQEINSATPEQALRHPTWKMGPKITIDSATLMNKALEVIEARWLFDLPAEKMDVIVHPESIVHSFVEFVDGSVMAQLSPPDMRLPIQYALTYPERLPGPTKRLAWSEFRKLTFEPPDRETFPALDLGFETARMGGTCGAVLNAADEAAVEAFLTGQIRFPDITAACRAAIDGHAFDPSPSLEVLMAADTWARREVSRWIRLRTQIRMG